MSHPGVGAARDHAALEPERTQENGGGGGMKDAYGVVVILFLEIVLWLGMGVVAGAVVCRRSRGIGILASAGAAVTFASMARVAGGQGWGSARFDVVALIAAAAGAYLGAKALRALVDAAPVSRSRSR